MHITTKVTYELVLNVPHLHLHKKQRIRQSTRVELKQPWGCWSTLVMRTSNVSDVLWSMFIFLCVFVNTCKPCSDPGNLWRLQPGLPGFLRLHRFVELSFPHPGRDLQCQPAHEALQKVFLIHSLSRNHFNCFHFSKIQFIEPILTISFIWWSASFSVKQKNVLNWMVTPMSAAKSLALNRKVCFFCSTNSFQRTQSPFCVTALLPVSFPLLAQTNRY